jgi:hypothetical protein
MNQFDCQNLTSSIAKLGELKARVDLALNKFEPVDGVRAKEEADALFDKHNLFCRLGGGKFKNVIEKIGGYEALKRCIVKVKIGGISGPELDKMLVDKDIETSEELNAALGKLYATDQFQKSLSQPPEEITTIRLPIEALGIFNSSATNSLGYVEVGEIRRKMLEAGLEYCPPEVVPNLLVRGDMRVVKNKRMIFATEGYLNEDNDSVCFGVHVVGNVGRNMTYLYLEDERYPGKLPVYHDMLFCLPDRKKQKNNGTEI